MRAGKERELLESAREAAQAWYAAADGERPRECSVEIETAPFDLGHALDVAAAVPPRKAVRCWSISDFWDLPESDDDLLSVLGRDSTARR